MNLKQESLAYFQTRKTAVRANMGVLEAFYGVSTNGKRIRALQSLPQCSKLGIRLRAEQRRITVSRGSGSVSYGSGVTLGRGVKLMGATVDPATQRIEPTRKVTETIETRVSFIIEGTGTNAAGFCKKACKKTREVATEMSKQFGL